MFGLEVGENGIGGFTLWVKAPADFPLDRYYVVTLMGHALSKHNGIPRQVMQNDRSGIFGTGKVLERGE